ncbi:hypothetical protein BN59_03165 [Legionella massiliensis]|uniref:Lytic transglycosylase MltA domain-containing protein n=1 Tax=Legionella massiliensis TaxID=1034943 RepID=A0A078L104_9GAMM|nr:hypothetical protein [Legionella massiliensis]CDZ78851.1 hypothetical protein BN59_03165 [Legionella massiliensis]CEE14589.1 hypothetical protein BN1094_03165 [Legionella massiliensis]
MRTLLALAGLVLNFQAFSAPQFKASEPLTTKHYEINSPALCATAKETLAYLAKGHDYDPQVIHQGKVFTIPLSQLRDTLIFICENQSKMNDPAFVKAHFDFFRWYPDQLQAKKFSQNKPLLEHLPNDRILMTKYYVHLAKASTSPSTAKPFGLYALPNDEQGLSLEEAEAKPDLTRFKYGKQAILAGALANREVPALAYLSRDDLEAALLQGTLVADFGDNKAAKIFNVHRCNNIAYNKTQPPYLQNRYWYFKEVDGIKGYGKDADHKITVNPEVTFAADLQQLGLGKLLMVQYPNQSGEIITKVGILADTGGAFNDNLYQVDFLAGSYPGQKAFYEATRHLPDYVNAYFMVLKP